MCEFQGHSETRCTVRVPFTPRVSTLKTSHDVETLFFFYLRDGDRAITPLIIRVHFIPVEDPTGSSILILVGLKRTNNEVEPSPVD